MKRNYNNNPFRSIAAIFGSFLIQMTFGSTYTADNFNEFIKSSLDQIMYIFVFAMFGLSASMSFGGFIEKKLKRSKTIFLGCIIMSYAVFISGIIHDLKYLTITYGLFCGLGAGLTYAITLGVPSQWSDNFRGFIVGIILSGFALGPIFYKAVTTVIPNKIEWGYVLSIFSGNYIVIQIIGIILIKKSKSPTNIQSSCQLQSIPSGHDIASHKLFFEFDFWIIWLNLALNSFGIILFFQLYPIVFEAHLKCLCDRNMIYVVSLTNAFGRILWGYLSDKISKKFGLIILNFGSIVMYALLIVLFKYTKNDLCDFTLCYTVIGFYYVWVSGNFTLIPALMVDRFGEKYFPTNYGYIFTSYSFVGIVTCLCFTKMNENFELTLYVLLLMSLLSFLLSILLKFYSRRSITWTDLEIIF